MRLAVFCDDRYRAEGGAFTVEAPFGLFLMGLAGHCRRLVLIARVDPAPGHFPYPVVGAEVAPLGHYDRASDVAQVLRATIESVRRFWRILDDTDVVWLLGPHPWAFAFAGLARLRGRRVVLGVRQDLPQLIRLRHPGRRFLAFAATAFEHGYRLLGRRLPVVVVGPELARTYRNAVSLHTVYVSLVAGDQILDSAQGARAYDGTELTALSVGRLEAEKNPVLLAEVLASALGLDPRWRLVICGDGPLRPALAARLDELGVADRADLLGHVPLDGGLRDLYRSSHAFLHVSLTEGMPQVILEAFAARLPVAATAVGGVTEMVSARGVLVPPADAAAAAAALQRLVSDAPLREAMLDAAEIEVREHTFEAECARLAGFLEGVAA
jgi:glycosyltransferase involved in cell wall biosynthesis